MTVSHFRLLKALERPIVYSDGIEGTLLHVSFSLSKCKLLTPCRFPLKKDVERCNNKRLEEICEPEVLYRAVDTGGIDIHGEWIPKYKIPELLDRLTLALDTQKLKVGRQNRVGLPAF